MKKFKKVLAMGLACVMALSVMSIGAFAATEDVAEVEMPNLLVVEDGEISPNALIDNLQFMGAGYINADGVNLRSGPSTSYTSLGLMYYGSAVTVYADTTTSAPWWYVYVTSGNCKGKQGYVHADYVTISNIAKTVDFVTE